VCRPVQLSLLVAAAFTATATRAQIAKNGARYVFHIKTHAGMKVVYLIRANFTPPPAAQAPAKPISVVTPVVGVVTGITKDVSTVDFTFGPPLLNGQREGEARSLRMKVDGQGRTVGAPAPGLENLFGNLPTRPLKVGDSYTNKQTISFAGIPLTVDAHYVFVGEKTVHSHHVADFTISISGSGSLPGPQGGASPFRINGSGAMRVGADDGLTAHSSANITAVIGQNSPPTRLKVSTTIDRK